MDPGENNPRSGRASHSFSSCASWIPQAENVGLGRLFTMFRGKGAKALSFHEVALDSKNRINVSAFCAGTFADSQFSPRDKTESNDENLIEINQLRGSFSAKQRHTDWNTKPILEDEEKNTDSVLEDQKMIKGLLPLWRVCLHHENSQQTRSFFPGETREASNLIAKIGSEMRHSLHFCLIFKMRSYSVRLDLRS